LTFQRVQAKMAAKGSDKKRTESIACQP
jgi:hypothetical protein